MHKEVKDFIKSGKKIKIFVFKEKNKNASLAMSHWVNIVASTFRYLLFLFVRFFGFPPVNVWIYRMCGVKIGKNTMIGIDVIFDHFHPGLISIGDDCTIGWGTKILSHEGYLRHFRLGRVAIGNNVLIGSFSMIRSGVTIGDDAIIAMGSLVNKDVPPNEEVGGIPDHEIKKLRSLL